MLTRHDLSKEQAEAAMEQGEFDETVRQAARHVAVVLTQDWCGQWLQMDRALEQIAREEPDGPDIHLYQLVYNRVDYFERFLLFKERVLGNALIPYVRYYRDGRLIGQSNYVSAHAFLSRFRE